MSSDDRPALCSDAFDGWVGSEAWEEKPPRPAAALASAPLAWDRERDMPPRTCSVQGRERGGGGCRVGQGGSMRQGRVLRLLAGQSAGLQQGSTSPRSSFWQSPAYSRCSQPAVCGLRTTIHFAPYFARTKKLRQRRAARAVAAVQLLHVAAGGVGLVGGGEGRQRERGRERT